MKINFILNGENQSLDSNPLKNLLDILREHYHIKSIQPGCRQGLCGSCLILLESQAVPACLVPAFSIRDKRIETVEALNGNPNFIYLEKSFLACSFTPCPYCAASKTILAESLLRQDYELTETRILEALPSRWCSCTSSEAFCQAVLKAKELRQAKPRPRYG